MKTMAEEQTAKYLEKLDSNIPYEQRLAYCQSNVTLNGKPAAISGARCQFARVWELGNPTMSVEYSWYAVQRTIEERNGAFNTDF